jgi:guanylate kinase
MDKPIILCIVAESGAGKTMVADYIAEMYGWQLIESRTTRPRRTPDEGGHTFITDEEFDSYAKEDMIAFTQFGNFFYCCLHKDVPPRALYVIDEFGLRYLKENFSDIYHIISLRLHRDKQKRIEAAGEERVARDEGKFIMKDSEFDYVCVNPTDSKVYLLHYADSVMENILDKYV